MIALQIQDQLDGSSKVQDLLDYMASGQSFTYNGGQTCLARIVDYKPETGMVDLVELPRKDLNPRSPFYGKQPRGPFKMPAQLCWNAIFF